MNDIIGNREVNPMPNVPDDQLVEDFSDFFYQKIITIRDSFDGIESMPFEDKQVSKFTKFAPFTQEQIENIIFQMNTTSCELDPISTKILKQVINVLLGDITRLINLCLRESHFPRHWKSAIVRPLLKKINLDRILKSYRPVSNLSFLSKLLEKCALQQLINHCDNFSLQPDYQSAYRTGYSCDTYNIKIVNDILTVMETQKVTPVVLLDLSAAFDTDDHELLISCLENDFGLTGSVLQSTGFSCLY